MLGFLISHKKKCKKNPLHRLANVRPYCFHIQMFFPLFSFNYIWKVNFIIVLLHFGVLPSQQDDQLLAKLTEYSSLASCFGKISKDFETCNTVGVEKAKSVIGNVELSPEWAKRLKCCGMWKLRECWMKAARVKCTKAQADQVFRLPHLFLPAFASECAEFTLESGKCTIPMWMIASVISVALFVLIICVCSVFVCVRKCRRHRKHHRPPQHRTPSSHQQRSSTTSASALTHLMPSANGSKNHFNGKNKPLPSGKQYMNGNNIRVPIVKIEPESSDENKSLNGSFASKNLPV